MNKSEIVKEYFSFIKDHKIPVEDFVLCAGGACLMYDLREETDDMDMDIPEVMFEELEKSDKYKIAHFGSIEILTYNKNIDLHIRSSNYQTRIVEGVCCMSPNDLLSFKLRLNRSKDQKDIANLQELLGKEETKPPAYVK